MIPASRLDGLRPVELLQDHDPGQMVGEGHFSDGQVKFRFFLYSRGNAEGGADEKAGGGLSHVFHLGKLCGEFLTAEELALGGEYAQPGPLGNRRENGLRLDGKPRGELGGAWILRQSG